MKLRRGAGFVREAVGNNLFFFNNSLSVMHRALMERLYYVKSKVGGEDVFVPCPQPTQSFSHLDYFSHSVRRNMPALPPVCTTEQFVMSYAGSKKARYAAAAVTLARTGARRSYGYLKTFIKGEFYDGTSKTNPCPRLIQPRSPEYNILVGRWLRPMEKLIYKGIDKTFGHHVVLKCDTPWQRASTIASYWGEFNNPCFVGLDASRFDQHTSKSALSWEHSLYLSIHNDADFAEYLSWQIDNVGYANAVDGSLSYKVEGCRMSGDMNTSLGNVVIMCGVTHHYLKDLPCKWRFINDGDDCGVFLEREDLHYLRDLPIHHLNYGYEMTVEPPAYEIEHVEFCQCKPINCGNGLYMMVRNIHKAIKQDMLLIERIDWADVCDVIAATGTCGMALYEGMPMLDAFYSLLKRASSDAAKVKRVMLEMGKVQSWRSMAEGARGFPIDETAARVSIYKAFGFLPDAQIAFEDECRAQSLTTTEIPTHVHSPSAENKISYYLH